MRDYAKEEKYCHPIIGPHPKACKPLTEPKPAVPTLQACKQGEVLINGVCHAPAPVKPQPRALTAIQVEIPDCADVPLDNSYMAGGDVLLAAAIFIAAAQCR